MESVKNLVIKIAKEKGLRKAKVLMERKLVVMMHEILLNRKSNDSAENHEVPFYL
jgi:hypothetical protein